MGSCTLCKLTFHGNSENIVFGQVQRYLFMSGDMEVDINSLSQPGCVLLSGLQRARRQTHYTCESPDSLSHLFLSFALNVDLKNDCMLRVISLSKNRVYKGL